MKFKDYFFSAILILIAAAIVWGIMNVGGHDAQSPQTQTLQGLQTAPQYLTATNSSVACPAVTSTLVVAGGGTRNNFTGTNKDASNKIYLCKALTCATSTGMTIYPGGGAYEQLVSTDGYNGPYSCISDGATSTLTDSYNQ